MSRTTLCTLTAGALAGLALGTMLLRYRVLGDEAWWPVGPGTWKVTLAVQGTSQGHAQVKTAVPLHLEGRQRLTHENYASGQMACKPLHSRSPLRHRVLWSQRSGKPDGPFKLRAEFRVALRADPANPPPAKGAYAAPRQGEYLASEPLIEVTHEAISAQARLLTAGLADHENTHDVADALFRFVKQQVQNDVRFDGGAASAAACLAAGCGDSSAKSRLLVALLRNRKVPARVVAGLALARGAEQQAHYWVEAWVYDRWMPMCPFHKGQRFFGRVPPTYLVLALGDFPLVTARRVGDLKCAFLVEKLGRDGDAAPAESRCKRAFKALSLATLPPTDRRLMEILLLLPLAALIICLFRNVIGLHSFGTFAPALIGLAFHHDFNSLPGILVFVTILLVGWLLRRGLDHYHLLQVPRVSLMLTLIMAVLIGVVVLANRYGLATTRIISLFPMVILTGMVERFWTLETEDSTMASFKTLLQTMFIATTITLVLSRIWVVRHFFCFPETLGLVMAGQLLIGRYTGYRLTELFRFRDFLKPPAALSAPPAEV
jgi:hypothetical protein